MKVKELIALLQDCNPDKEVTIDNDNIINTVQELFFDDEVVLFTAPKEEEVDDMEKDTFFLALAEEAEKSEAEIAFDEMMGGIGEMLDALKINGVR